MQVTIWQIVKFFNALCVPPVDFELDFVFWTLFLISGSKP